MHWYVLINVLVPEPEPSSEIRSHDPCCNVAALLPLFKPTRNCNNPGVSVVLNHAPGRHSVVAVAPPTACMLASP